MKKLFTICLLVFFTISGNAQWYHGQFNVSNISELNKDQLNLALSKSLKAIKAGEIWTGVGIGVGITGGVLILDDMSKRQYRTGILGNLPTGETAAGVLCLVGGIITTVVGVHKWTVALKQKTEIEMELVKFKGSASMYGIGLKIKF
jgi:hypothetical protein